jgi:hypothetical protein
MKSGSCRCGEDISVRWIYPWREVASLEERGYMVGIYEEMDWTARKPEIIVLNCADRLTERTG